MLLHRGKIAHARARTFPRFSGSFLFEKCQRKKCEQREQERETANWPRQVCHVSSIYSARSAKLLAYVCIDAIDQFNKLNRIINSCEFRNRLAARASERSQRTTNCEHISERQTKNTKTNAIAEWSQKRREKNERIKVCTIYLRIEVVHKV